MSPFLGWGDFPARSRFASSTIPEEKAGTTRSLGVPPNYIKYQQVHSNKTMSTVVPDLPVVDVDQFN